MDTLLLAQQLGLVELIPVDKANLLKHNIQIFDFLIVLDFEATCWDKNDRCRGFPEIIEFPAVFYSVRQTKILVEFQQYVMPTETPKLTTFCTGLTAILSDNHIKRKPHWRDLLNDALKGRHHLHSIVDYYLMAEFLQSGCGKGITQNQVDQGVPLPTALMLFSKWTRELINKYDLTFEVNCLNIRKRKCALVTWSDWDLGTCLRNECKRKRISKSDMFNKWIDLRLLYKEHYNRRPKGLSGALSEVGLNFEGTEHCGLDDAKNTASLARKMVADGVLLRITKDLNVDYF